MTNKSLDNVRVQTIRNESNKWKLCSQI